MRWPQNPTCHGEGYTWRLPRKPGPGDTFDHQEELFRTCSYCGSICPEDFAELCSKHSITLGGTDWKYGFPHKFYIEGIPNPVAGQQRKIGSASYFRDGKRIEEILWGAAPAYNWAKLYTAHLEDDGYDDESRDLILRLVSERSGIRFERNPSNPESIQYSAPYFGYQR